MSGFSEGEDEDKAFYSVCNKGKICVTPPFNAMLKRQIHVPGYMLSNLRDVKKLKFSPDTDTIGLGMVNLLTMDVVIQVSKGASDKRFVHLNALVQALSKDVDLNSIPTEKVLHSPFVLSGCDFTSSFVGFGKVATTSIKQHLNWIDSLFPAKQGLYLC